MNKRQDDVVNIMTLSHELAHILCGHLDSIEDERWPQREKAEITSQEFEAESVAYLVCKRLGLKPTSEKYLVDYLDNHKYIPPINIHSIIRSVEWVEDMLKGRKVSLYKKKKSKN